ncbi:MAG: XdhC family protein [Gemmatimonadota bacterium]|nr:XdhC family protein [Gemmatimonadota bacterium]
MSPGAGTAGELDRVLAALERAIDEREPIALATIVRARGSTPRGVGSRMAIAPDASTGTVGGGCGEAEVIEAARAALEDGRSRVIRVDLTEDLYSWSPAVCGGVFDVLFVPYRPDREGGGEERGRRTGPADGSRP